MIITQVTPGIISIPPNGWGAVEKIIWNYFNQFNSMGHSCDIRYLNGVDTSKSNIVHIHIANLAIEAHKKGIPYIFSLHDHHVVYQGKDSFVYKQNLEAIKKSIISFCHAEYLVDYFEETDKLFYLSHGVDVDTFKVDTPIRNEHKLLCIANNGIGGDSSFDRKGFRYAIEAARILDMPITIAGPENNNEFFKSNEDLLSYDKLTLILSNPNEEEVLELYKAHSIFLHPSCLEAGHPNLTILEAVSCGLPVVGTYEGTRKINGMIITERNSELIANSIQEIINNYEYYVKESLKNRDSFNWRKICDRIIKIYENVLLIKKEYDSNETKKLLINNIEMSSKLDKDINYDIKYNFHFVDNPFFEILGNPLNKKKYKVQFFDKDELIYESGLNVNMWSKLSRQYYTEWKIKVYSENELIFNYTLNLKNHRVLISFESSSLGDNIAWIPYIQKFKEKHDCHVIVSTFWNTLFQKSYPDLEFIMPGTKVDNLFASYRIGWFYDSNKEPEIPNTIPLQKTVTNILGIEYKELLPKINFVPGKPPIKSKYITIANESTSGLKYWNNPEGWEKLVNYLQEKGYKVINISKNGDKIKNTSKILDTSIENTMNYIYHSELFIGLSSGLSWLAWGIGKHVVMISNFSEPNHEFTFNCTRIINHSVCNSCWNHPSFKFDKGDWNWCPKHKNTERQFECHKSITADMVISQIQHLI